MTLGLSNMSIPHGLSYGEIDRQKLLQSDGYTASYDLDGNYYHVKQSNISTMGHTARENHVNNYSTGGMLVIPIANLNDSQRIYDALLPSFLKHNAKSIYVPSPTGIQRETAIGLSIEDMDKKGPVTNWQELVADIERILRKEQIASAAYGNLPYITGSKYIRYSNPSNSTKFSELMVGRGEASTPAPIATNPNP